MSAKGLILSFFVVLFLIPVFTTQAQEDSAIRTPQTLRQDARAVRGSLTDQIQKKRLDAKTSIDAKRKDFKESLLTIKDERKQNIVERINNRISTINENRTNRFAEVIDKLKSILDRVIVSRDELSQQGYDVTELDRLISSAEVAIADAEDAISQQAEKEYIIELGDESTLRSTVGQFVAQVKQDLRSVRSTVVAARKAVRAAVKQLRVTMSVGSNAGDAQNNSANIQPTQ